jgi:hypothetical protein
MTNTLVARREEAPPATKPTMTNTLVARREEAPPATKPTIKNLHSPSNPHESGPT